MSDDHQKREEELSALQKRVAFLESELDAFRKPRQDNAAPLISREAQLAAESRIRLGTWYHDLETAQMRFSEELFLILGYDSSRTESTVENFFAAIHPEDRQTVTRHHEVFTKTGLHQAQEYRVLRKDGSIREIRADAVMVRDSAGRPVRMVGTLLDLTEQRQFDARLRQSSQMEAVGRLAAEMGGVYTRQLLSFGRLGLLRPADLDLNEVVRDTARLIESLIGEDKAIRLDLAGDRLGVLADRAQLQQILLNLSTNARDAMPGGGEIRISTRPAADPRPGPGPSPAEDDSPASWVRLTVQDSGSGMDEAIRSRVFEPFFTTKEPGMGTGMGLYAVLHAVSQAQGHIAIDSAPGRGTSVEILLPRRPAAPVSAACPPLDPLAGSESVLVVEDHPALRELIRCFLADAGYAVQAVGSPGEAEALFGRTGGGIDLLVTDLVMPDKNGRALAAGLAALKLSLKVLYISGYAQGAGSERKAEGHYLQKPFTRLELLKMVRSIFDARVGRAGTAAPGSAPTAA